MILEELMHERFATYSFFKDQMAVYAGLPAVFYQGAPDDRQKGWEGEQYPRIVYTIDMQADEERKSAGVMQVDLYCDERKNSSGRYRAIHQKVPGKSHREAGRKFTLCVCLGENRNVFPGTECER